MNRRPERGQTLVEMALILPIFLLLLVSIFDLGHVVWANDTLSNAAREGARYAIVHGGSATNPCPVGPPSEDAVIPAASTSCPFPAPSKQAIKDAAINWARSASTNINVYVCYGNVALADVVACDANADDSQDVDALSGTASDARGQTVTVLVKADVGLAAPAFFGFGSISLQASSTMVVNH
jgi:Flp pilus assembly protein TadG